MTLNNLDATVIAALVAAVAAITTPLLTALVNNRHQSKMRKIEILQDRKIKAIQNYTSSCSKYLASFDRISRNEYYSAYGQIFLYTRKEHWKIIDKIQKDMEQNNTESAYKHLSELSRALSSEMNF